MSSKVKYQPGDIEFCVGGAVGFGALEWHLAAALDLCVSV